MALVPDQKFSTFNNGGDLEVADTVVGLRNGVNTRFNYTGTLPSGVIIPVIQGGTGANNPTDARSNLGLGVTSSPTFTNLTLNGGQIFDMNSNQILGLPPVATAVNFLNISNSATGTPIMVTPNGSDSNIQLNIFSKGTGSIVFGSTGLNNQMIIFTGTSFQHETNFNFPTTAAIQSVTFPDASGTVAFTSQLPTGAALTSVNDTNVTVTLGGSPSTALLNATSITLGWTGQLAIGRGGTGISSFGTGVQTALGQNVTGTGSIVLATSPSLVTPVLGTPTSGNLVNCTGAIDATAIHRVILQVFTSSGTYTPTTGMRYCIVRVLSGSSAGGGATSIAAQFCTGSGAGSGSYSESVISAATIGVSQVVTVGAAGTAVVGGNGNVGSASSLGALVTTNPGAAGLVGSSSATNSSVLGGAGGVAGTGNIATPGNYGGTSFSATTIFAISGAGAASQLGGGTRANIISSGTSVGIAGGNYGAGGSGGVTQGANTIAGGAGSPGIIIITEYCS